MNEFDNVIDIAKLICGFIFSHSEEMPADVTEMVFGISTTYISVCYKGTCIGKDNLEQDLPGLFARIMERGGRELNVTAFMGGQAFRFVYVPGGLSQSEREDPVPEGTLFRVTTGDGKNTFLKDREAFLQAIAEVFATNGSAPDPGKVNVFLNGSAIRMQPRGEHTLR